MQRLKIVFFLFVSSGNAGARRKRCSSHQAETRGCGRNFAIVSDNPRGLTRKRLSLAPVLGGGQVALAALKTYSFQTFCGSRKRIVITPILFRRPIFCRDSNVITRLSVVVKLGHRKGIKNAEKQKKAKNFGQAPLSLNGFYRKNS